MGAPRSMGKFFFVTLSNMDASDSLAIKSKSDYNPRKCSVTNQLLNSKDHASVQINAGQVDQYGIYTGEYNVYALCGALRRRGESDSGLNRLAVEAGFMNARILK